MLIAGWFDYSYDYVITLDYGTFYKAKNGPFYLPALLTVANTEHYEAYGTYFDLGMTASLSCMIADGSSNYLWAHKSVLELWPLYVEPYN